MDQEIFYRGLVYKRIRKDEKTIDDQPAEEVVPFGYRLAGRAAREAGRWPTGGRAGGQSVYMWR
jgi:hypothetical protein